MTTDDELVARLRAQSADRIVLAAGLKVAQEEHRPFVVGWALHAATRLAIEAALRGCDEAADTIERLTRRVEELTTERDACAAVADARLLREQEAEGQIVALKVAALDIWESQKDDPHPGHGYHATPEEPWCKTCSPRVTWKQVRALRDAALGAAGVEPGEGL